jgi:hypothetical protein
VYLMEAIRWIPNHRIKTTCFEDFREFRLPVKDVDTLGFFFIHEIHLFAVIEIRADERIAAFDVAAQIGERPFVKELALLVERLSGFVFQHFE